MLSSFELELVDTTSLQSFRVLHSTPFLGGSCTYNVVWSWRSRWDGALQDLLAVKNSARSAEQSNPPESALAGGGYSTPQMRSKWHRHGGLSLEETMTHLATQAVSHCQGRDAWANEVRTAVRTCSSRLTLSNIRTLSAIAQDYPSNVGPCAELAIHGLRVYLRQHDIQLKPTVRRLRSKTQVKTLKARLAAHNSRTLE